MKSKTQVLTEEEYIDKTVSSHLEKLLNADIFSDEFKFLDCEIDELFDSIESQDNNKEISFHLLYAFYRTYLFEIKRQQHKTEVLKQNILECFNYEK